MKLLIFCRKAKALASRALHGWYEKRLTVEDLLAEADGGRFTWIGAGGAAVECCAAGPGFPGMQRAQDELPALLVEDENWRFQPLAPDTGLVIGRFRLTTIPESGLVLSEQQRATFLLRADGEAVRLCHIHISSPAGRKRRSLYAFDEPAARREYMGELAARRLAGRFPELTKRQVKVLCFLMQGLPYKDIADAMNITPRTVRYYVTEIERRLHAENRTLLIETVLQRNTGGVISAYGDVRRKTPARVFFSCPPVSRRAQGRGPLWLGGLIKKIYTVTSGTAVGSEVKGTGGNSYNFYRFIVVSWQTTKEGGIDMKMKKAYAAALAAAMVLTAGFSVQADAGTFDSITVGDILGGSGIQMNGDGSIIATGPITSTHVNAGKLDVAGGKFRVDKETGKVHADGGMTVNGDVLMQNGQGEGILMTQGGAQITSSDMENGTGSVTVKDGGVTLIGNSTTQVNVDKDGTTFIDRATGMSTTISGNQITTGSINAAGGDFVVHESGMIESQTGGVIGGVTISGGRVAAEAGLSAAGGKFSVDGATGNMSTEGSLTVEDGATINGGTTMNGGATVNGGLTADTISAMDGHFKADEEGIRFRTEDAADLTTYHYYFDMNNENGISFGHSNGASMSLNENGVTFAYGGKTTHINGDEISTGTVHADLVQASDMYRGDANNPDNQVVTKGELNKAVADGTENAVKYDDNGELHAGKEGTGKLDLKHDGSAALTSGNGEHSISVTDNGTTVTGGMTVEGGMTVSGGLKIDNGDGTTSSVVTDADLSDVKEKVEQNTSDISGIKTDVSGIKDQIGSETLKTTSQTLTGAINENHNAIQTNKEAIGDVSALKGTDANGNKYTNLTDAVNGNYDAIQQTQTQVQQNTNAISSLSSQVNDLGGEIDNVGAISAALAGLHPLDYDGTGSKFQLAAAMGSYDGSQAAAIGGFYHFNEDVMMSVGGATAFDGDNKSAFNVGVSFRIGQGSSGKKVNSDDVLAQLNAMNEKIAALEAENQQLSEKVAALEGGEGAEAAEAE